MKKIQDIVSPNRKSIRDISIERGTRGRRKSSKAPRVESRSYQGRRISSLGIWFIAAIAIIFLFFAFTILFSGTKVVVTPKATELSFESQMSAVYNGAVGTLAYDVITLSKETTRTLQATGEEFKESKASGVIVVYNDYNANSQKLIANTRFQTADGKIYRIKDPIVVPGRTKSASGDTIPGSIEVRVYADEEGSEYNIGLEDFTIPGFKGSPQYDGFYARSKTEMTGGFSGIVRTVEEADKKSAREAMQNSLRETLLSDIRKDLPEDVVLYDDGIVFSFRTLPENPKGDDEVDIVEEGTLHAIVFDRELLSQYIARENIDDYDGLPVEARGIEDLLFVLDAKNSIDIETNPDITFLLSGDVHMVWSFDDAQLATDLVNKKKRDIDWVLAEYPSIAEAEIIMRPFWKRSFPDTEKNIKITEAKLN